MAKTQKNKMLIVMVGTDERPAGDVDLESVKESLEQVATEPDSTFVTHHAIAFKTIKKPESDKVLVIKLGSDERPAGPKDIKRTIDHLEAQKGKEWGCIVTHHAVCFSEIDRGVLSDGIIIV